MGFVIAVIIFSLIAFAAPGLLLLVIFFGAAWFFYDVLDGGLWFWLLMGFFVLVILHGHWWGAKQRGEDPWSL
jgi:hypothetical protein